MMLLVRNQSIILIIILTIVADSSVPSNEVTASMHSSGQPNQHCFASSASGEATGPGLAYTRDEYKSQHPSSGYSQTETGATRSSDQYDTMYDSIRNSSSKSEEPECWERPYSSNPNETTYDGGPNYSESYRNYSNSKGQNCWDEEYYGSNWQDSTSSSCNQQRYSYTQDSYFQQTSPSGYCQANSYDRGYHQDRPYSSTDYHNDQGYSHDDYRDRYDYGGNQEKLYWSKKEDFRQSDSNRSSDRDYSRKDKESKSSDSFVQRRSAFLKRAELHQGGKNAKASRGPQIVNPHRLSDSFVAKKSEKSKPPEGSFPKRNLDKFKIPKKKNLTSTASPIKKSVPIPALEVKENAEQTKLAPTTTVEQTKHVTSRDSSVVKSNPTAQPTLPMEKSDISKTNEASEGGTNESVKATQNIASGSRAKKQRSVKVNAIPTVLSTLDPKTLLSLAVTLQKSIEKVCLGLLCFTLNSSNSLYL